MTMAAVSGSAVIRANARRVAGSVAMGLVAGIHRLNDSITPRDGFATEAVTGASRFGGCGMASTMTGGIGKRGASSTPKPKGSGSFQGLLPRGGLGIAGS